MIICITGGAGFIGSHLCEELIKDPQVKIISIDNFNTYYNPQIKRHNIQDLEKNKRFKSIECDIRNKEQCQTIFKEHKITHVIHLAAMAGVRPSIEHPELYFDVNINGTLNILECCKTYQIKKCLLASSSSVYGNNKKVPFSESDPVDHPISPYAASKKANEVMAHTYYHLYHIPMVCLRFFTVYGPRQRPEMAIHKFTKMIDQGQEIPVFNHGNCLRDYTYIQDIVLGIKNILLSAFDYDVVNIGESQTISTLDLIQLIEKKLGKKAILKLLPAQPGDVDTTYADITKIKTRYHYEPKTTIEDGVTKFIEWYHSQIKDPSS